MVCIGVGVPGEAVVVDLPQQATGRAASLADCDPVAELREPGRGREAAESRADDGDVSQSSP